MKKILIAVLVCINVSLLVTLILGVGPTKAEALEGSILRDNYIMITGHMLHEGRDGVYVVDLATGRLAGWQFDPSSKRLKLVGTRRLRSDIPTRKAL
ncbi:MAG: hypothetical protein QF577_03660 [Phycisphaerae bacterium]|jgi:hypothetical protein|nr:hypothetical protein [Phycisphaerae bacterium]